MPSRMDLLRSYKERITQQLEQSGVRYWKPPVGTSTIRILPSWTGDPNGLFFKPIFSHWNIGEGPKKKRVICPTTDGRTDCPICQLVEDLFKTGTAEDEREAKEMIRRERFIINILDMNAQDKYQVLTYEMGPTLFKDILFMFTDGDFGPLDDPTAGRNIRLERSGRGLTDTRYIVMPAAQVSAIDMKLIKEIPNLDVIYKPMSAADIEKVLLGGTPGEPETPEEETEEEEFLAPVQTKPEAPAPAEQPKPEAPAPPPAPDSSVSRTDPVHGSGNVAPTPESAPAKTSAPGPTGAAKTQFNLRERLNKLRTEKTGG